MNLERFAFEPIVGRTRVIDRDIRAALVESVSRVIREAERVGLRWSGDLDGWRSALLATERSPPRLWAVYHDLVQAILREDADAVPALAADLLARRPDRAGRPGTVVTISDADLGPVDAVRYRTVIDSNPERPLGLRPAAMEDVRRIQALVDAGRALLDRADSALRDEIDTLGHQIVLATGADGGFGGAATVFLWGAVILNPDRVPDRVTLVESLAHETAHALLFGLTLGADLTANAPGERYGSPLRPDPRPIEGIVHATYVLARMTYALERLREHPEISPAERSTVAAKIAANRANYEAGLSTVREHAVLTPDGRAILEACIAWMAAR